MKKTFLLILPVLITGIGLWLWEIHAGNNNVFSLDFKDTVKPVVTGSQATGKPPASEAKKNKPEPEIKPKPKPESEPETKKPTPVLFPKTVLQGGTIVFVVQDSESDNPVLRFSGKPIKLFPLPNSPGKLFAVVGVDVKAKIGKKQVVLNPNAGADSFAGEIEIRKGNFSTTELVLSETQKEKSETPASAVASIAQNDSAVIYEVLTKPGSSIYLDEAFQPPLKGKLVDVGGFGVIRKSGNFSIRHLGVDLDAHRGDPVFASQNGLVRLARRLDNFGNTIIIDHGAFIFSLYLHLDSIKLGAGEIVKTGDIIGTVGNTGAYSLNPHLHFSVKIGDASVDPLMFLKSIGVLGNSG